MARPTLLPSWATSSSAEVSQPNDGQRIAGFRTGEIVVTGFVNWLFSYVWTWIAYLDSVSTPYTSLTTACDSIAAGGAATVYEDDSQSSTVYSASTSAQVAAMGTNGRYLVWATASANPSVYSRDIPGTVIRTLTRANTGTNRAIAVVGDLCAVAYNTRVDLFRVSTGARIWTYDHGAAVYDVAIYDTSLYLVGAGSAGVTLRQIILSLGTVTATYNHGATLYSVWADAGGLYVAGTVSGGVHMRAFSLSVTSPVWSVALPVAVSAGGCLRGDDIRLYVGMGGGGDLCRIERLDGSVLATFASPVGWEIRGIDIDHGAVWAVMNETATGAGRAYRLSKDLSLAFTATASEEATGIASDMGRAWTWGTPTGANPGMRSSARVNRPGVYYRRDTNITLGTTRIRWRYHRMSMSPAGEE